MIRLDFWIKRTGLKGEYSVDEKHMNIVFFGGLFMWKKALEWTVYTHDFRQTGQR